MSQASCDYCGQPFRIAEVDENRDYYCCAGCALRARVPVDARGNYPVNADLVGALAVGFLYFNQLMDWALGSLVARQGKAILAQRFIFGSVVMAVLVWLGVLFLQRRAGALRGKDYVVAAVSLTLIVTGVRAMPVDEAILAGANALVLIWAFRGVFRRKRKV